MTDIYDNIPQESLCWLDRLSGKTGAALPADAQTAPTGWLPAEVSARLEPGKTYVMTINDEVLAVTAPDQLIRGLESTAPASHEPGSTLYQAFTAHQLTYLIMNAGKSPAPSGSSISVGHLWGATYGYSQDYVGELSEDELDGYGTVYEVLWAKSDLPVLQVATESYIAGGMSVIIGFEEFTLKSVTALGHGFMYSTRAATPGYTLQPDDPHPDSIIALPDSGEHPIEIKSSDWTGFAGIDDESGMTLKVVAGSYPANQFKGVSDRFGIGYMEPGYFPGRPRITEIIWNSSTLGVRLKGDNLPDQIEVTIMDESAQVAHSQTVDGEYIYYATGSALPLPFRNALPSNTGEYIVTINPL